MLILLQCKKSAIRLPGNYDNDLTDDDECDDDPDGYQEFPRSNYPPIDEAIN